MEKIINEIKEERERQDSKWGKQNHCPKTWLMILGEEVGEANKAVLESATYANGKLVSIDATKLIEGKGCYREELVQIAAVALAMVECLDRGEW